MAAPDLRGLIHVGYDILTTTVNTVTHKILAQLGDVFKEETDTDNAEWWQHVGFASRPPKPEAGKKAAQAVCIRTGDHDVVIASQDLRGLDLYGALDFGETCLYAPGTTGTGQARVLLKKDGSVNIFTKSDNDSGGDGMGIFVAVDGSISIVSHTGAAFTIGSDGAVRAFNENGALQIGADGGAKVSSTTKVSISAPAVVIGGMAAQPTANLTEVTSLLAMITALQLQVTALGTAVAALVPVTGILDPTGSIQTAAAAAVAAGTVVVTAGVVSVPAAMALKRVQSD